MSEIAERYEGIRVERIQNALKNLAQADVIRSGTEMRGHLEQIEKQCHKLRIDDEVWLGKKAHLLHRAAWHEGYREALRWIFGLDSHTQITLAMKVKK
jgi:hypothetical protein